MLPGCADVNASQKCPCKGANKSTRQQQASIPIHPECKLPEITLWLTNTIVLTFCGHAAHVRFRNLKHLDRSARTLGTVIQLSARHAYGVHNKIALVHGFYLKTCAS